MKASQSEPAAWRSSTTLVIFTSALGLFTETFLYGFVVPIMSYMFEVRLGQDPKYTQRYSSAMLFILGAVSVLCAPLVGHLADKTPNRKIPLLVALAVCVVGTILVAATWSVWSVFVGRLLEGISGTAAWIIAFSMLTDNIDKKHYGKTLGFTTSFVATGILSGPAVSGILLEWAGYWPAWSVPFTLLFICLIARLVMADKKQPSKTARDSSEEQSNGSAPPNEATGLLEATTSASEPENAAATKESVERNFYRVMLTNAGVVAALLNTIVFSVIIAAFDATFPLHLQRKFNWGPAPTGLIFLAIQIPGLVLAPVVGWLRDRHGVRWPTAIGWLLQAPLMWFAGVPGTLLLPGLRTKDHQEAAFVACIVGLGIVVPLVRGSGTFHNTLALREVQDKNPGIFGPNGGSSRLFALTEVVFNIGLMSGPIIGGALADMLSFYWMMFGMAILCFVSTFTSAVFLSDLQAPQTAESES